MSSRPGAKAKVGRMDPLEFEKLVRRCRMRALDGVPIHELVAIYGKVMVASVTGALTEEERQKRNDCLTMDTGRKAAAPPCSPGFRWGRGR